MSQAEHESEDGFGFGEGEATAESLETLSPDERGDEPDQAPPDFREPKEPKPRSVARKKTTVGV